MTSTINITMEEKSAYAFLAGKVCCYCLTAFNETTTKKMELTNADWTVDYDVYPCEACWAVKETEEEETGEYPKWMEVFNRNYDAAVEHEDGFNHHHCEACEKTDEEVVIHDWGCVGLCEDCSKKDGEPHCPKGEGCDWCDDEWEETEKAKEEAMKREVKVWWFKDDTANIQVTKVTLPDYDRLRTMVKCRMIDQQCFQTDDKTRYRVWMNDNGLYEDTTPNPAAEKVLRKIALNWGSGVLKGNYVVTKETKEVEDDEDDEDDGWRYVDMDVTDIRRWIAEVNETIKQRVVERNKWMKEMEKAGTPVTVIQMGGV